MGLREKKAQKAREAIYDAMLTLTERDGFEAATMEQVAERAEVALSTVYRYFANKDAILLYPFEGGVGGLNLADVFRARPEGEDVTVSLGWAVRTCLDLSPELLAEIRRLRAQLDLAPGPRARLWDLVQQRRTQLEEAIAERSDRDELWNSAAAHLVTMVIEMALDHNRDSLDATAPPEYADRVIMLLRGADAPIPARE